MSRTPRKLSEADLYHVFARGVGRQMIFEDAEDNRRFLDLLKTYSDEAEGSLLAWCLMGNHFHLLVKMKMSDLSSFMKRLEVAYALHYNSRYDRPGCLFQGRFGSEPILDDAQLLAAVRYIHLNPVKAGIAALDKYEWSSYREYVAGCGICDTGFVLDAAGDLEGFRRLHSKDGGSEAFMEDSTNDGHARKRRASDGEVQEMLEELLGSSWRTLLPAAGKDQRNNVLGQLKERGATVRQLSRLTGIGRSIVQKAKAQRD